MPTVVNCRLPRTRTLLEYKYKYSTKVLVWSLSVIEGYLLPDKVTGSVFLFLTEEHTNNDPLSDHLTISTSSYCVCTEGTCCKTHDPVSKLAMLTLTSGVSNVHEPFIASVYKKQCCQSIVLVA